MAAARFGIIPDITAELPQSWFNIPRETRAMMTAAIRLENLSSTLARFDQESYWEAYSERKAETRKRRKGGRN